MPGLKQAQTGLNKAQKTAVITRVKRNIDHLFSFNPDQMSPDERRAWVNSGINNYLKQYVNINVNKEIAREINSMMYFTFLFQEKLLLTQLKKAYREFIRGKRKPFIYLRDHDEPVIKPVPTDSVGNYFYINQAVNLRSAAFAAEHLNTIARIYKSLDLTEQERNYAPVRKLIEQSASSISPDTMSKAQKMVQESYEAHTKEHHEWMKDEKQLAESKAMTGAAINAVSAERMAKGITEKLDGQEPTPEAVEKAADQVARDGIFKHDENGNLARGEVSNLVSRLNTLLNGPVQESVKAFKRVSANFEKNSPVQESLPQPDEPSQTANPT